jgi:hypothetical protein
VRWLLARLGPVSAQAFAAELGCTHSALGHRGGFAQACRDLFSSQDELIANRLLFKIYSLTVPHG